MAIIIIAHNIDKAIIILILFFWKNDSFSQTIISISLLFSLVMGSLIDKISSFAFMSSFLESN